MRNTCFSLLGGFPAGGEDQVPLTEGAFFGPTLTMSLRSRIILLFALLAIVPMLVVAGFSYGYVRSALREAVEDQLRHTASVVGQELERSATEIDRRLATLAASISRESVWDVEGEDLGPMMDYDSLLARAAFMGVRTGSSPLRVLAGALPAEPAWCSSGQSSGIMEFSAEIRGEGSPATLTAGFWAADLVTREGRSLAHSVTVVDPADGTVLYADGCEGVEAGMRLDPGSGIGEVLGRPGSARAFRFREGGERWAGAVAPLPSTEWVVVAAASMDGMVAPLSRLATSYWIFVVLLGVSTALAFSVLIGGFTRSLSELARAAEEIGLGELDPWLPLHTSGELGKLTTAFSAMLARIRQMMAQVDQSGRMAVVGQLSAYLAHEIRNPLSSIKLNLQRLRRWAQRGDLPEYCMEPLEISLREVERLNASVTGVLQLSRAEDSPREMVRLHDLVEEAADLLGPKFRRQGVGLSLRLNAPADRVLARVGQVKSAVLNLMVNALEAQPNGGRLEVRSELARVPELGGPVVALHFRDQGPGIPAEIRDRIFEPFFTTKPGGSGIGLAMASQVLRANGGELSLEPSFMVGEGSDFVALFPLAALEAATESSRSARGGVPASASSAAGLDEARKGAPDARPVPTHLMSPDGLRAVLSPSGPDTEEVN